MANCECHNQGWVYPIEDEKDEPLKTNPLSTALWNLNPI